jgi:hypothetical protein
LGVVLGGRAMTRRLRVARLWVAGLRVLAGLLLRVARLLTVSSRRRLSEATGRATLRRPPTATLHQNFTEEPQPQLPVVFGLLNLKPEP